MATIKGQNLRVLQGIDADSLKCVAASTSCAVHVSMQLEENTNKDVDSDWITQEPTSLAWDVQVDALVLGEDPTDTGATPITELVVGRTYVLKFSRTLGAAGEKNRDAVADEITYIGQAILNDFTITAQNGNLSTATAKFTGAADLAPYEEDEDETPTPAEA